MGLCHPVETGRDARDEDGEARNKGRQDSKGGVGVTRT